MAKTKAAKPAPPVKAAKIPEPLVEQEIRELEDQEMARASTPIPVPEPENPANVMLKWKGKVPYDISFNVNGVMTPVTFTKEDRVCECNRMTGEGLSTGAPDLWEMFEIGKKAE